MKFVRADVERDSALRAWKIVLVFDDDGETREFPMIVSDKLLRETDEKRRAFQLEGSK